MDFPVYKKTPSDFLIFQKHFKFCLNTTSFIFQVEIIIILSSSSSYIILTNFN